MILDRNADTDHQPGEDIYIFIRLNQIQAGQYVT